MKTKQGGFTLIELMITVVILAIVVAIAAPNFNTQINNNRSAALAEELVTAVNYARSEAVRRGSRVSICASGNGSSCTGSWTDGWIVVVDSATSDSAASPVIDDAASDVLRVWAAPEGGANLAVSQDADAKTFVRFTRLGTLGMPDSSDVTLASSYSGCSGNAARAITVGVAGMVRVARESCSG